MRFFHKLLILFLVLAILPLVSASLFEFRAIRGSVRNQAEHIGTVMVDEAVNSLRQTVDHYGSVIKRQGQLLEMCLDIQAREAERALAEKPGEIRKVYFASDYDGGTNVPDSMQVCERYWTLSSDGKPVPRKVTFEEVEFLVAPGINPQSVWPDIARLAPMVSIYRLLLDRYPDLIVSLFTALKSGVICSYPGTGGYPQGYDPRQRAWYTKAEKQGTLVWNEPYVDATGMGVVSSVSRPVYWPDGSFAGVTALDVTNVQSLKASEVSFRWASKLDVNLVEVAQNPGTHRIGLKVIGKPEADREASNWKAPLETEWLQSEDPVQLSSMIAEVRQGRSGVLQMPFHGRDALWAFGLPWGGNDVALVLIANRSDVVEGATEIREFMYDRTWSIFKAIWIFAAGLVLAGAVIAYKASLRISEPLKLLSASTRQIATGNLNAELPDIKTKDEIGELARSVEALQRDLKVYIDDLTEATAARERVESEMKIARNIQMSFLPKKFPAFPHRSDFDIYASITPAREVGGDLYDFFLVDDRHLFFAIGDVSGKGVPAALFMALTKSLMKGVTNRNLLPQDILAAMNRELCEDNDALMFVSLFCGILDTRTGEIRFSNAGHIPPLIVRNGKPPAFVKTVPSLVLGGFKDSTYKTETLTLLPGECLFLYTDGVTEARNAQRALFSADGLKKEISSLCSASPRELIDSTMESIRAFSADAPQSDDIAMLVIRFNGS